jgi:hypothetical protein
MSDAVGYQNYLPTMTSILALAISSLTLGWTIYRDAIRKPKFRVDIAVKKIVQQGHPPDGPYVFVEALNMGPIPNRIGLTFLRKNWIKRRLWDRKHGSAMLYPDYHHWATTKASSRLEVGDQANFVFPYDKDSFLKDDYLRIGVSDGFGRTHWSSKRDFRLARNKYRKDFPIG